MFFGGVLLTGLGMLFGVGFPVIFYILSEGVPPWADLGLNHNHETTTAVMMEKKLITHTHSNSQHPWKVTFRFATADRQPVIATGYTYDQSFAEKAFEDVIDVEYDPADPTRARPVGGSASLVPAVGCTACCWV